MADYPVPGYENLVTARPQGTNLAGGEIDLSHVSGALLAGLDKVGATLRKTVTIFSGYRTDAYSAQVGGFAGDPHSRGIAVDANIGSTPIGDYPGAVSILHALGLRSGATDFTYHGNPDPSHVDTLSTATTTPSASPSTSSIKTADDFWYAVETRIGAPHRPATHAFLVAWSSVEDTKAHWNPLATTRTLPGSTTLPGNTAGVQQYATPEEGVQATADTIKGYPTILAVLRGKASPFGTGPGGVNPLLAQDLNTWSGHRDQGAAATSYVRKVILNFQGNPKGQGAADWTSGDGGLADAGTAAKDAALAVPAFLGKVTDPAYILRGLQIVAGAVMVLVGVVLLTRQVALANDLPDPLSALSRGAVGGAADTAEDTTTVHRIGIRKTQAGNIATSDLGSYER